MNSIVFYLVLITCGQDKCHTSKVQSYPTLRDCQVVAASIFKSDDTIYATCQPGKSRK